MEYQDTLNLFEQIFQNEKVLLGKDWRRTPELASEIYGTTKQLLEIGASCLLPRSYVHSYHLVKTSHAVFSIGSHTHVLMSLLDRAIDFDCSVGLTEYKYGFNYRVLMEAARRHDLPENVIGDLPDDGTRNNDEISTKEAQYWSKFSRLSPEWSTEFERDVTKVLNEMHHKKTPAGKLLYLADKCSAIIEALSYDVINFSPIKITSDRDISAHNLASMKLCDTYKDGYCKASELWMASDLKLRNIGQYDNSGFFVAVLVMATLQVNGYWYHWRQLDYT